jgi:hypothetical protein
MLYEDYDNSNGVDWKIRKGLTPGDDGFPSFEDIAVPVISYIVPVPGLSQFLATVALA